MVGSITGAAAHRLALASQAYVLAFGLRSLPHDIHANLNFISRDRAHDQYASERIFLVFVFFQNLRICGSIFARRQDFPLSKVSYFFVSKKFLDGCGTFLLEDLIEHLP